MKALLYLFLLACFVSCNSSSARKVDPRVLTLPAFNLQLLNNEQIMNTGSLSTNTPVVFMYFSPACVFSRKQTEAIIANYRTLQHIRFLMCSAFPLDQIDTFYRHYQLNRFNNITVGRDKDLFFEKQLNVPSYPWLFIYTPDRKLKKIITGFADAQLILDMIKG